MFLNPYAYAAYLKLQRQRYARSPEVRAKRREQSRAWAQKKKQEVNERQRVRRAMVQALARLGAADSKQVVDGSFLRP